VCLTVVCEALLFSVCGYGLEDCSTNQSEELSLLVQLLYHAILMQHECYCIETTHSLVHNAGYALEKHRFSLVVHMSFMYQYCVTYCFD